MREQMVLTCSPVSYHGVKIVLKLMRLEFTPVSDISCRGSEEQYLNTKTKWPGNDPEEQKMEITKTIFNHSHTAFAIKGVSTFGNSNAINYALKYY